MRGRGRGRQTHTTACFDDTVCGGDTFEGPRSNPFDGFFDVRDVLLSHVQVSAGVEGL